MTRRIDLLCASHEPWDTACETTRELMARFAASSRVLYVEPPAFGAVLPELVVTGRSNLLVTAAMRLPDGLEDIEIEHIEQSLLHAYLERPRVTALWLTSPEALAYTRQLRADVIAYQATDDVASAASLAHRDRELVARADIVLAPPGAELDARRRQHPRVVELPRGGARVHTWDEAWSSIADLLDRLLDANKQVAA